MQSHTHPTPPNPTRRCARLDSHILNERPDEGDELEWRHGNYKTQHKVATQHLGAGEGSRLLLAWMCMIVVWCGPRVGVSAA